jgi:hypothetical protein
MSARKHYFIHKRFQTDFTLKIVAAILLPVVVCTLFIVIYLETAGWLGATLPDQGVKSSFWFSFLLRVIPVAFIIFVFSVLFSHRIAGPVRRMQNTFKGLPEAASADSIRLRKKDFFHDIAKKLNMLNGTYNDSKPS